MIIFKTVGSYWSPDLWVDIVIFVFSQCEWRNELEEQRKKRGKHKNSNGN